MATESNSLHDKDMKELAATPGPRQYLAFDELARRLRNDPATWKPAKSLFWGEPSATRPPTVQEAEWAFLKWSQHLNDGQDDELFGRQRGRLEELECIIDKDPISMEKFYFNEIGHVIGRAYRMELFE